ncbi:Threonylcarbamoyladenosine tRNA methylthiotransferase MtaB [subsurface metagenome]
MNTKELSIIVINHGCKLNQFEGEALENSFRLTGFKIADLKKGERPDITIINTCTVTGKSDRKSRNSIYKAVAIKKTSGLVIVTGCYAETNPDILKEIRGVDFVLSNREKAAIPEVIKSYLDSKSFNVNAPDSSFLFRGSAYPERSRVFVKVQDGCSMSCTYCKVPLAREQICQINAVIVIITSLLLEHDDKFRIRLSSIEPFYFRDGLFEIIRNKRIVPHFHIPVQSGSDRILKLMNRPYNVNTYREIVRRIESVRPESHFSTDIIVGFPTENKEDFQNTMDLIRSIGFASIHVFKYSERDGTKAAVLKDDVSYNEKALRSRRAISKGAELNYLYRKKFLGNVRDTIFENHKLNPQDSENSWEGITDNYIRVKLNNSRDEAVPSFGDLKKRILPVRITRVEKDCTYGEIVEQHS